jgi:hypothetical protein
MSHALQLTVAGAANALYSIISEQQNVTDDFINESVPEVITQVASSGNHTTSIPKGKMRCHVHLIVRVMQCLSAVEPDGGSLAGGINLA